MEAIPERIEISKRFGADIVVDFHNSDPVDEIMKVTNSLLKNVRWVCLNSPATCSRPAKPPPRSAEFLGRDPPPATGDRQHLFYRKLDETLDSIGFAAGVREVCRPLRGYRRGAGAPGIDPAVYFKMLMIGFSRTCRANAPSPRAARTLSMRWRSSAVSPSEAAARHQAAGIITVFKLGMLSAAALEQAAGCRLRPIRAQYRHRQAASRGNALAARRPAPTEGEQWFRGCCETPRRRIGMFRRRRRADSIRNAADGNGVVNADPT
ncbi:MAG: hypothetical protein R3F11_18790 [Verrucomicrobiales bacterium]